ncbi:hypothetical protein LXL04_037025 [Taraxacum kok-saghyz]
MISVGSRDEKKGLSLRYGFEGVKMETMTEIEEGEACFQSNYNDDSTIDPDISLSYIDEKIQNILRDCQKDFEYGYTPENLGAKVGEYGSFLPTYQRSPFGPPPKTPSKVLAYSVPQSPNNVHIEYPQSSASQPARKGSSSNDKQKQEVSTSCGDKSSSRSFRSVNNVKDSDQKSLKVRIKVGSDNNLSTRKKAEIYSGLGLDISPSSSMEASPVYQNESPTSILEIMTSFPVMGSLVSPLPYDVLHLMEKEKGSQESSVTALHGSDSGKDVLGDLFDVAKVGPTDPAGKIWESNNMTCEERNHPVLPMKTDSDVSIGSKVFDSGMIKNEPKGQKAMKLGPNKTSSSSSGGKRKTKGLVTVMDNGSQGGLKNESLTSKSKNNDKKNSGKAIDTYKVFFGELDLDQEDEVDLKRPSEGNNGKSTLKNESLGLRSEKPSSSVYPRVDSLHVGTVVNGVESGVTVPMVAPPVVNEDWVCCDKCEKWRLLPPGVNPSNLPEKWLCSLLDWLPGMNRCSISEEETTKAITGPSVQGSQPVHPSGPHQHLYSQIPHAGVKKKNNSKDVVNENKQDRPSMSSNSSKKNLHTSSYKSRSLNAMNPSPVNGIEFQDSGQSKHMVVGEKDRQKQKDNNTLSQNFVDEGDKKHDSKISKKRESSQDFTKDSKKVKKDVDHGTFRMGKFHERDIGKKRKRANEVDGNGTPKYVKETNESNHNKEKKAKILLNPKEEGVVARKGKNIEDVKMRSLNVIERKDTVMAATSSSSKVSGSHKTKINNQEAKGSPVGSVSSSPLQILNSNKGVIEKLSKKKVNIQEGKSKEGKSKSYSKFPSENGKAYGQSKIHHTLDVRVDQDSKKPSKNDVTAKGKSKSKSLPPRSQSQTEKERQNVGNNNNNVSLKNNKKDQNQNGNHSKQHPTPEKHEGKDQNTPVLLVRDISNQATTNALREATNLKHMADRVKNGGSSLESRSLYMQAALKFLHVASVFESCHKETGRYGDMIQSISIYSSTAKLCEYCAHEYERTKEMTTAALAYKCMEVAYMKVIFSSHSTATKDVNELQSSLHIGGPTGSSPCSSSDLDNLKGVTVNTPQVGGNHVITARLKPNFTRILNLAQDVNYAMEASRKSRIAFGSSKDEMGTLSAIKTALDFNFHDVEGLLHRVRVAMEVINR